MAVFFHYVGAIAEVLGIVKLRRGGDLMGQDILLLDAKFIRVLIINIKELSPAALDMTMVLDSRQNSNEGESQGTLSGSDPKLSQTRREDLPFAPKAQSLQILGHALGYYCYMKTQ
ncbi:hypothetical protein Rs2_13169 [Raphanus sativus]|nr:hypothetical protein Rs2_26630 [Raphanus sativus]KAJ4899218.1 hypothetical protein Rs2_13169 [Raphanus sativus]